MIEGLSRAWCGRCGREMNRGKNAELLVVMMVMDRLGCDRESRVEDARIVIHAACQG